MEYWRLSGRFLRNGPEGLAVTLPVAPVLCRLGPKRVSGGGQCLYEKKVVWSRTEPPSGAPTSGRHWSATPVPRRGKQRRGREGVLFAVGLAAVLPVQPSTADPIASIHHNAGLAAFRPAQKKTAEPRRRVPPSAQEVLIAWRSRRLDLIVVGLRSSSSLHRQVVVAFLDIVVGLSSSTSPFVSPSLRRIV